MAVNQTSFLFIFVHYVSPFVKEIDIDRGVENGPSKIVGLAKFLWNFTGPIFSSYMGLTVSFFHKAILKQPPFFSKPRKS